MNGNVIFYVVAAVVVCLLLNLLLHIDLLALIIGVVIGWFACKENSKGTFDGIKGRIMDKLNGGAK